MAGRTEVWLQLAAILFCSRKLKKKKEKKRTWGGGVSRHLNVTAFMVVWRHCQGNFNCLTLGKRRGGKESTSERKEGKDSKKGKLIDGKISRETSGERRGRKKYCRNKVGQGDVRKEVMS